MAGTVIFVFVSMKWHGLEWDIFNTEYHRKGKDTGLHLGSRVLSRIVHTDFWTEIKHGICKTLEIKIERFELSSLRSICASEGQVYLDTALVLYLKLATVHGYLYEPNKSIYCNIL